MIGWLVLSTSPSLMSSYSGVVPLLVASLLLLSSCSCFCRHLRAPPANELTLEVVRERLTRDEDSIVFCLIERARFSLNSPAYDPSYLHPQLFPNRSIAEFVVRETEAVQAKAGRYRNSEEIPYFPDDLPLPLVPPYKFPMWLHPAAASVNVSNSIWDMYFNILLPLFTAAGEDGNYASSAESDLVCLQALSRRIHYGRFVAEVKFRDAPENYTSAIYNKDKSTLMKLVTSESQEAAVQKRVENKAAVFGQDVTLETKVDVANKGSSQSMYKVDPLVVSRLYKEWVIPMTKIVEVDYLLRRLD